jgi:hypothetical protein
MPVPVMATMGNVGEAARHSWTAPRREASTRRDGHGARGRGCLRPMRIMTTGRPDLTCLMHIKPGYDEKLTRADVWSLGPCR